MGDQSTVAACSSSVQVQDSPPMIKGPACPSIDVRPTVDPITFEPELESPPAQPSSFKRHKRVAMRAPFALTSSRSPKSLLIEFPETPKSPRSISLDPTIFVEQYACDYMPPPAIEPLNIPPIVCHLGIKS